MRLNSRQLAGQLKQPLKKNYLVCGEELLLAEEAASAVLKKAWEQGYTERIVLTVEPGFDWHALMDECRALSLFAQKRIIDLRLPTGKPGDTGSATLTEIARREADDILFILRTGKLDKAQLASKWVKALDQSGIVVIAYPVGANELPAWISERMKVLGVRPGPGVIDLFVHRYTGNLLALAQELEKLTLQTNNKEIYLEDIEKDLRDDARFNVFELIDVCLRGHARDAVRIVDKLRREDVQPVLISVLLAREVRAMGILAEEIGAGKNADAAFRARQVWPRRQPLVRQAIKRVSLRRWQGLLQRCAHLDRVVKGRASGETWREIESLCLAMCGVRVPRALLAV